MAGVLREKAGLGCSGLHSFGWLFLRSAGIVEFGRSNLESQTSEMGDDMIQTIIRREYLVVCDGCGQPGPAAGTLDHASELVRSQDWQAITPVGGLAFLMTWLCPSCQHQREIAHEHNAFLRVS